MKNIFLLFFVFAGLSTFSESNVLLVEGKYQNKNVFVQNGFNNSGVGFCAYEVKVNGQVTSDEVNSSAFEVDLAPFKFNIGDKVTIEIKHKDGCIPKVLNPEVLKPKPTFDILDLTVNNEGILNWTSKNEMGSLPYVIEQYKWNKWVFVGEVNGQGTPATHSYSFKIIPHSGENKFRLKQTGFGSAPRYSNPVTFNSLMEKPNFQIAKDSKSITFSSETAYEVYDFYGNVVKKGYANTLDISNLNKGKYYLCYDTVVTEIEKRK
jgi:hypothetical protein